jgi:hypothetical protein
MNLEGHPSIIQGPVGFAIPFKAESHSSLDQGDPSLAAGELLHHTAMPAHAADAPRTLRKETSIEV